MKKKFLFVLLFCLIPHVAPAQARAWRVLDNGLLFRQIEGAPVYFFKIDPQRFRFDLLLANDHGKTAMTSADYRKSSRALLVINGGFFDEAHRSLGLLLRQGKPLSSLRNNSWGVFTLAGKGGRTPMILPRDQWNARREEIRPQLALQVGPRLVIQGTIPHFKEFLPAQRSAVGVTNDHWIEIGIAKKPLSLGQWAALMKQDCVQALNLDGGGSSQISVKAGEFSMELPGETPVPNALAIYKEQP